MTDTTIASQTQQATSTNTATPTKSPVDIAAKLFPSSTQPAKAEVKAAAAPTAPAAQANAPSSTQATQAAQTPEKPATETAKPAAEEKAPPAAEAVYTITAPEGADIDTEVLGAYQDAAKELGLPKDAAQNLINKLTPVMQARADAQVQAVRASWTESSKSDSEFGGTSEKLAQNLGIARKALDSFGSQALKEFFDSSGLGSHPEVIRLLWKAGKAISNDSFVGGSPASQQPVGNRTFNDLAEALYAPKARN